MKPPSPSEVFRKYCHLRHTSCDLTDDNKRLKDYFHDDRIELRFNVLYGFAQVWYMAPSGPYVVFNIPDSYSYLKARRELYGRQKTRKQLAEMYESEQKAKKEITDRKIDDAAGTLADGLHSHVTGKVTTSMR